MVMKWDWVYGNLDGNLIEDMQPTSDGPNYRWQILIKKVDKVKSSGPRMGKIRYNNVLETGLLHGGDYSVLELIDGGYSVLDQLDQFK